LRTLTLRGFPDQTLAWAARRDEPVAARPIAGVGAPGCHSTKSVCTKGDRGGSGGIGTPSAKGHRRLLRGKRSGGKESPLVDSGRREPGNGRRCGTPRTWRRLCRLWPLHCDRDRLGRRSGSGLADKVKIGRSVVLREPRFLIVAEGDTDTPSTPGSPPSRGSATPICANRLLSSLKPRAYGLALLSLGRVRKRNEHLDGPPLLACPKPPARPTVSALFSIRVMSGIRSWSGRTGAGKSVFCSTSSTCSSGALRPGRLIFRFRQGARLVLCVDPRQWAGSFYELKADGEGRLPAIGPALTIPAERAWAAGVGANAAHSGRHGNSPPKIKEAVWSALGSLGKARPARRAYDQRASRQLIPE